MNKWAHLENMLTLVLSVSLVCGFYYLTNSAHSFWWLLLLGNLNGSAKANP